MKRNKMFLKIFLFLFFAAGLVLQSGIYAKKQDKTPENGDSIKGCNLVADKKLIKMAGAGAPYMATLDEKQIDAAFADLKKADIKILKILASYRGDKPYSFETEFGKYNENAFEKLDYIISAAEKNNISLIIALCDDKPDFGGKEVYRAWTQGSNDNALFVDKISREYFKKYIENIVKRKNTITGKIYGNDPAIFAWDLCDGIEDKDDKDGSTIYAWTDEMSSYIKTLDKTHFVTISIKNVIDSSNSVNSFDLFLIPSIDFIYYNAALEEKGDMSILKKAVADDNKMFYKSVDKPVIMGFSDADGSTINASEISKIFFDMGTILVYNNSGAGDYAKKAGVFNLDDEKTRQVFEEIAKSAGAMHQETPSIDISGINSKAAEYEANVNFTAKAGVEAVISYGQELPLRDVTDKITLKEAKGSLKIQGLKPDTKYFFMIKVSDSTAAGISKVLSFNTKKLLRMTAKPFTTSNNFITAKGPDFYDGNRIYRFLGSENYYLRYAKYFDYAKKYNNDIPGYIFSEAEKIGFKNMRVFTMQEGESMDTINKDSYKDHRYLRIGPDFYDEQAYKDIDYVLDCAKKHGMRIILCFVDNWNYNGGIKTITKWAGVTKNAFWTNDKTKEYYKQNVQKLVLRKNTYNGLLYKNDPTIFAWDLCNEPRDEDDSSAKTLASWINEMAAYVKSLDKNHMVTAGLEGYYLDDSGKHYSGSDFILCQQSKDIDFTTFHIYPASEWSHFSKSTIDYLFKKWIKDSHEVLKKPIVMEEFGITKGLDEYPRAEWIDYMLGDFFKLGGNGADYWFLVEPDYTSGDGNDFIPNDTDIVNTFVKYTNEINKKGY